MEKIIIKNRKNQKIVVIVDAPKLQKGLAFIMHGLGGFKEQVHLQAMAEAFLNNGYASVRFDTTNTFGESEGNYEDATTTNYYEDLEDVISWAKTQKWYQEPFVLAGHSLGGISVAMLAQNYPEKVKALAPIATVVSGKLSLKAHKQYEPEELAEWEKTGWLIEESHSRPGVIKKLKWSHITDRLKYDLLPQADKLKMPVLLIIGEDDLEHLEQQKILYEALPGEKELHIIKGALHTFRQPKHLAEIKQIFNQWLEKLE